MIMRVFYVIRYFAPVRELFDFVFQLHHRFGDSSILALEPMVFTSRNSFEYKTSFFRACP